MNFLAEAEPVPVEVSARAEEVYQWITLQHPWIESALRKVASDQSFMSLLFATTGHLIPPPPSSFGRRLLDIEHEIQTKYRSDATFLDDRGVAIYKIGLKAYRKRLDTVVATTTALNRLTPLTDVLIKRSMSALHGLYDPRFRVESGVSFQSTWPIGEFPFHQKFLVGLRIDLEPRDIATLERLHKYVEDADVRRALVLRVSQTLPEIIRFHRTLFGNIALASDREGIRIVLRNAKSEWVKTHPLQPIAPPPTNPAIEPPRPEMTESFTPIVFDLPALDLPPANAVPSEFLDRPYDFASLAELSIHQVQKDLRAATAYLSAQLARAGLAYPESPDWTRCRSELTAGESALGGVESRCRGFGEELDRALDLLVELSGELLKLKSWLDNLNARLVALDLHEGSPELAKLSSDETILLGSIHSRLPKLGGLNNRALEQLMTRRIRTAQMLDALTDLGLLATNYHEIRLRGSEADRAAAWDILGRALAELSDIE